MPNDEQNRTLCLSLKKEWYDMIESGVKTEEYRDMKPYWMKRIRDKKFNRVRFSYGYTARTMTYEIAGIRYGKGNPEWGAAPGVVYIILSLGKRVD